MVRQQKLEIQLENSYHSSISSNSDGECCSSSTVTERKNSRDSSTMTNIILPPTRKGKKKGHRMTNPYICEWELDELKPDHTIIDYAYFVDGSFVLVALLTSHGDVQFLYETAHEKSRRKTVSLRHLLGRSVEALNIAIGPQATFIALALASAQVLLIPVKLLLDVTWGGDMSRWTRDGDPLLIDLPEHYEQCLQIPTSVKCFLSNYPERPIIIVTNKGGMIYLIDLSMRKCFAELKAPQSIHNIEIFEQRHCIEMLVTSFTGAQWLIPLEYEGCGVFEVLHNAMPSKYKLIDDSQQYCYNGSAALGSLAVLRTADWVLDIYKDISAFGGKPKIQFQVPPETWLTHATENIIFTVTRDFELRSAMHFGMGNLVSQSLEYLVVRGAPEWRILGFIPLPFKSAQLSSVFVVNERGLFRVVQDPQISTQSVASCFLFRISASNPLAFVQGVAKSCGLNERSLTKDLIPSVLSAHKVGERLKKQELANILTVAKSVQMTMDQLLELFTKRSMETQLLPEVLRIVEAERKSVLRAKVVDLYVKKCETAQGEADFEQRRAAIDHDLSTFLSRHADLRSAGDRCVACGLWRSASLLSSRDDATRLILLRKLAVDGPSLWKYANHDVRSSFLGCLWQLEWQGLDESHVTRIVAHLCDWQRDLAVPAYYETCLSLAQQYESKYPKQCAVLYLVSAMYILSQTRSASAASCQPLAGGLNCGLAVTIDDRLMLWGDLSNKQKKQIEASEIPLKRKTSNAASTPDSPNGSLKRNATGANRIRLPTHVHLGGRPLVVQAGAEHTVVLTNSGQLWSWGGNRYGQCGLGHTDNVPDPQVLKGNWPEVVQLSAGQFHTGFVAEDGSVWMWGWGLYGQLGMGSRSIRDHLVPKRVEGLSEPIVSISCGRVHTVLLTKNGKILVAGGGSYGQLGSNEDVKKRYAFEPLDLGADVQVTHIATRFYHTLAATADGRLFEWGRNPQEIKMKMFVQRRLRNAHEKAGDGAEKTPPPLPCDVPRDDLGVREVQHLLDAPVESMSTGLSHSAIITTKGSLFTWGKALEYQLGHGTKAERSEPHQVFEPADVRWSFVECGGNHTIGVSNDGRAFGWGRNDFGQCGVQSDAPTGTPRKYFYQAKEGAKRCIQLPDDSAFVMKPTMIADLQIKVPVAGTPTSCLDEEEVMDRLHGVDTSTIRTVSSHFLKKSSSSSAESNAAPIDSSIPILYIHLLAGNVLECIEGIGRARARGESVEPDSSLSTLSSLALDVVLNQEDCQTRAILAASFRHLPLTAQQKKNSQVTNLWPNVWNEDGVQDTLSNDEKLTMLENWQPMVRPIINVEIPVAALKQMTSRVRVWAACGHVESVTSTAVSTECSICADEWKDRVRETMGAM